MNTSWSRRGAVTCFTQWQANPFRVPALLAAVLTALALIAVRPPATFAAGSSWQKKQFSDAKAVQEVFCINLDRHHERWDFMQEQFREMHMVATRWSAVDGQKLDVNLLAQIGLVNPAALKRYFLPDGSKLVGIDLTPASVGTAISHMHIWRHVILKYGKVANDARVLVVEDDCEFLANFRGSLDHAVSQVPQDFQILFLGGQDLMQQQELLSVAEGVRRLYRGFRGTTAYLISVEGCKACLEVAVPLSWQIDTHLTENEVRDDGNPAYTAKPLGYCLHPPVVRRGERKG